MPESAHAQLDSTAHQSPTREATRPSILVVEAEDDLRELLHVRLARDGYRVTTAAGADVVQRLREQTPDLVLLDLILPDVDGVELCRRIRSLPETAGVSIVILTARSDEQDVIRGFEAGADDYVTKPFSPRVLSARIKAILRARRRAEVTEVDDTVTLNGMTISRQRHEVTIDGEPVELTATEFRLLRLLAEDPGCVFSRQRIIGAIHGPSIIVTDRSVDVLVLSLRRKLGRHSHWIETIRGVGYRLRDAP